MIVHYVKSFEDIVIDVSLPSDVVADMILAQYDDPWEAWCDVLVMIIRHTTRHSGSIEYGPRALKGAIDYRNEQIERPEHLQFFNRWATTEAERRQTHEMRKVREGSGDEYYLRGKLIKNPFSY